MRHPLFFAASLGLLLSCTSVAFGDGPVKPKWPQKRVPQLPGSVIVYYDNPQSYLIYDTGLQAKRRSVKTKSHRLTQRQAALKAHGGSHFTQQQRQDLANQLLREGIGNNSNPADPPRSYAERLGWKVTMLAQEAKR